jgi:hypothetical protein
MKKTDPAFEHIREIRHTISEDHAHDSKRLVEHYRRIEEKYKDRFLDPVAARESGSEPETG